MIGPTAQELAQKKAQDEADAKALMKARAAQKAKETLEAEAKVKVDEAAAAKAKTDAEDKAKSAKKTADDADAEQTRLHGLAHNRRQLAKKLEGHSEFMRVVALAASAGGLYILGSLLAPLYNSFIFDILGSLIFGSSTAPGIPVAMVQAFLPTAMASLAPFIAIAIPVLLVGYMFVYQYGVGKMTADNTQRSNPVPPAPPAPVATPAAQPGQPSAQPAALPAPVVDAPANDATTPAPQEKRGSLSPVTFARNQQKAAATTTAPAPTQPEVVADVSAAPADKPKLTKSN